MSVLEKLKNFLSRKLSTAIVTPSFLKKSRFLEENPVMLTGHPWTCRFAIAAALALGAAGLARPGAAEEGGASPPNWGQRKPVVFEALRQGFTDPDLMYAPFIFWFWDEPLNPAKAAEMARTIASQRMSPGYAHPRRTMVDAPNFTPDQWLTPLWFETFEIALKEAEARKNYFAYCDEYWWPSFQLGGRMVKEHPELKAQSLKWETLDVPAGETARVPASFFAVAARLDQALPPGGGKPLAVPLGKWIWYPDGMTNEALSCWLLKTFEIPAGKKVVRARIRVTADNSFILFLDGRKLGENSDFRYLAGYEVAAALGPGRHTLGLFAYSSGGPCGALLGLAAELDDGLRIEICSDKSWLSTFRSFEGWERSGFEPRGWVPAKEIAEAGAAPWNLSLEEAHVPATICSATLQLIGSGAPFTWKASAEGAWRVYAFNLYSHPGADGSEVNYLDERLPAVFIREALEPYAKRFGKRMGTTIPGDFVDNEGDYGFKLAWSNTLDRRYRARYDHNIRLWMPLLIDEDTEGVYARARWEWFDVMSDIYCETMGSVSQWHERRGMYCTVHVWEEGLQPQAIAVGDHLKLLRAYTMPGQDCLGLRALQVHDFKEPSSVAEFEGVRCMSELMGAGDFAPGYGKWGTFTPPLMKQCVNAAIAWGVSHIIPHGIFMTRKLDGNPWPPDWYAENPMFPYLHLWADFVRRASYVNSHGRLAADVLLMNPMDTVWALTNCDVFDHGKPYLIWAYPEERPAGRRVNHINSVYAKAIDELTAARVEFLVGDRHYVRQMEVKGGRLVYGEFAFQAVVLPPMDVLPLDVARKIVEFAKAGGRVYAMGELPAGSTGKGMNDPEMARLMETLRGLPVFKACPGSLKAELDAGAIGLPVQTQFESGGFPMVQRHLRIDGHDFFWLVNNSDAWRECVVLARDARGAAAIWDCETGAVRPAPSVEVTDGSRVALVFRPYEAYWLVFDPKSPAQAGSAPRAPVTEDIFTVGGPWTVRFDPTIQPVLEHPTTPPAEFAAAAGVLKPLELWKAWGLERFSGLADYSAAFEIPKVEGRLLLDLGKVMWVAEAWVNGKSVGARLWGPHVFDVTEVVKAGRNELRIRVANLVNNSYGDLKESGLLGPVRVVRVR